MSVDDVSGSLDVSSPALTPGLAAQGEFDFLANYYMTSNFEEISSENDTIIVGEMVNFGIRPSVEIAGISFFVTRCDVEREETEFLSGKSYAVLENQCPNEAVQGQVENFVNKDLFKLNYRAFHFNG